MPGAGIDGRAAVNSASMKTAGKHWKIGKLESHLAKISSQTSHNQKQQSKFINTLRKQIITFIVQNSNRFNSGDIKKILVLLRKLEQVLKYFSSGSSAIHSFFHSICSFSSSGINDYNDGRGPPSSALNSNIITFPTSRSNTSYLKPQVSDQEVLVPVAETPSWGRRVISAAAAAAIAGYISLAGLPGIKSLEPTTAQAAGRLTTDTVLMKYMNQSCEQTLKGTDVHYVNDRNYQTEVFGSKTPVMVLFYNNHSVNSSQGLTALTRALHEEFPQVKLCAYKIGDGDHNSTAKLRELKNKYPLKKTPSILFYDNDKGYMEKEGSFDGGISQGNLTLLKTKLQKFSSNIIPKYILD